MFQGGYSNFAAKRAARHGRTKEYKASLEEKNNNNKTKLTEKATDTPPKPSKPRKLNGHPSVMAYPSAKGLQEDTGDSLLIKCFKYMVPDTGIDMDYEQRVAQKDGTFNGQTIKVGEPARTKS